MERREFIGSAGLFAAGLAASTVPSALAGETPKASSPSPLLLQNPAVLKMLPHFAETSEACETKASICAQYCEEQMAKGNTDMSNCLVAARQMVVLCDAVTKLITMKSVRLSETLDACASACKSCKDACEEHKAHWKQGMHLECKACAEQCDKMLAEITKLKSALAKA
jgi:Cys-rich four helix bundle protein (predicted Tat secretion target)